MQNGQQECRCFTAACLARHQQISELTSFTVKRAWNCGQLNGCWNCVAKVGNRLNQLGG